MISNKYGVLWSQARMRNEMRLRCYLVILSIAICNLQQAKDNRQQETESLDRPECLDRLECLDKIVSLQVRATLAYRSQNTTVKLNGKQDEIMTI